MISAEIDMFCSDQKRVGNCEQTAASQRNVARKIGQLFCDDVVVFHLILQSFSIFKLDNQAKGFCGKCQKAINQGFSCPGANVGLVPFAVPDDVFVFQPPHLFVCEGHADCFFAFAGRNQNRKLFAKSGNV